jgi:hypothetical protein
VEREKKRRRMRPLFDPDANLPPEMKAGHMIIIEQTNYWKEDKIEPRLGSERDVDMAYGSRRRVAPHGIL